MKVIAIAACLSLLSVAAASAQEQPYHLLRGQITTQDPGHWSGTWSVQNQSSSGTPGMADGTTFQVPPASQLQAEQKQGKLKKFGRGLASAAGAIGKVSGAVAVQVLEAMLSSPPYTPPADTSFALSGTYHDGCVHGYTARTCPYGYYGSSYGSPYISGAADMRMRPDHLGGYRFYTSGGVSGTLRPNYGGGYQMQVYP